MSLTETETVFGSIHEDALNDLITAFCTDRPRYLVYGSPSFVPTTTVAETSMAAIAFPGVPGGIQWRVTLSIPRIDLYRQTAPLPPELTLSPGQFSAQLGVELCLEGVGSHHRPPMKGTSRSTAVTASPISCARQSPHDRRSGIGNGPITARALGRFREK